MLNKNWTFGKQVVENKRYFWSYITVYLISLIANLCFNHILVKRFDVDPRISNFLVIGVSAILNFLGTNFLVFKVREPEPLA